jgi:hypothetical protein
MTEPAKTPPGAIWSLVLGILGIFCIGPLGAIPAVICGHRSRKKILTSSGTLQGEGLALAGLILGYVGIGLLIVTIPLCAGLLVPAVNRGLQRSQEVTCAANLRQIDIMKTSIAVENNYEDGVVIPESELSAYMGGAVAGLKCPKGGTYTAHAVGQEPECSVHGTASQVFTSSR